jgi:Tol biopolymer transport system component
LALLAVGGASAGAAGSAAVVSGGDAPVWSPDSRSIAFVGRPSANSDDSEIYVINADGSSERQLTTNPAMDMEPSWSPDGRMIAFVSSQLGSSTSEIDAMNADGSNQRQLTDNSGDSMDPVWSPDGSMIAFTAGTPPGLHCGRDEKQIYVMNADGSDERLLVDAGAGSDGDRNLAWSPDGTTIAFDSDRGGKYVRSKTPFKGCGTPSLHDIYLVNADGSNLRQLTNNRAGNYRPVWSPEGTQITFTRGSVPYVMNADGSNQHPLDVPANRMAGSHGVLSPDWKQTAFLTGDGLLNVMNVDAGNRHQVTDQYVLSYDWSPNSREIAYTTEANDRSSTNEISVVNADGTHDTRLTP